MTRIIVSSKKELDQINPITGSIIDIILKLRVLTFVVSKIEFKEKYKKNPPNLLRQCDYCNSPQPRYKLHPNHEKAFPDNKYLEFKQCLPGCVANANNTLLISTSMTYGPPQVVSLRNDTSCVAYDASTFQDPSSTSRTHSASELSSQKPSPQPNSQKKIL